MFLSLFLKSLLEVSNNNMISYGLKYIISIHTLNGNNFICVKIENLYCYKIIHVNPWKKQFYSAFICCARGTFVSFRHFQAVPLNLGHTLRQQFGNLYNSFSSKWTSIDFNKFDTLKESKKLWWLLHIVFEIFLNFFQNSNF